MAGVARVVDLAGAAGGATPAAGALEVELVVSVAIQSVAAIVAWSCSCRYLLRIIS